MGKATRCKEVAGYTGPDATAPSFEEMNKLIVEEVVKKTLAEITLKSGKPALSLFGDFTHLHINPSGRLEKQQLSHQVGRLKPRAEALHWVANPDPSVLLQMRRE